MCSSDLSSSESMAEEAKRRTPRGRGGREVCTGISATVNGGGLSGCGWGRGLAATGGLFTGVYAEREGVVPVATWAATGERWCMLESRCVADRPGPRCFSLHPALAGAPQRVGLGLLPSDEKKGPSGAIWAGRPRLGIFRRSGDEKPAGEGMPGRRVEMLLE